MGTDWGGGKGEKCQRAGKMLRNFGGLVFGVKEEGCKRQN